jgi:hypothetical protein
VTEKFIDDCTARGLAAPHPADVARRKKVAAGPVQGANERAKDFLQKGKKVPAKDVGKKTLEGQIAKAQREEGKPHLPLKEGRGKPLIPTKPVEPAKTQPAQVEEEGSEKKKRRKHHHHSQ